MLNLLEYSVPKYGLGICFKEITPDVLVNHPGTCPSTACFFRALSRQPVGIAAYRKWLMKIATYNVNGINGRLPVLLRWLAEAAPDVACLQELKAPQEKFPIAAIESAGYEAIWHGQKSWNG